MSDDIASLDLFHSKMEAGVDAGAEVDACPPPILSEATGAGDRAQQNARMWAKSGSAFFPCDEAVATLEPAQYTVAVSQSSGPFFQKMITSFDEILELPDSASQSICDEISFFWKKEQHFRKFGFLWKRGFLLWGPPGSGKTCTLQLVSQEIVRRGGISVYVDNPSLTAQGLAIFRRIEPDRPCVVIMEDIDAMISTHGESDVLALLDGELQIDNIVFLATTNYPERLDKRIVNRPSRFDIVKLIGMPGEDARRMFIKAKNPRLTGAEATQELNQWVKETEGFSIAHLKELIVSVEVFEGELSFVLKRLRAMIGHKPKSTDADKNIPSGQYC